MKQEVKIGVFMVIVLLILAIFIIVVGDLSFLFKKGGYPLFVSFDSVAGLEKQAIVRLAGVKIGYVRDINLKESQAEVELCIIKQIEVPRGSKASLAALGLLGEKYVEILPGQESKFFQPGDSMEGIPPVSFDQIGTLLLSIGDEIKEIGKSVRGMLGEEEEEGSLKETLQNLSAFTADLKEFLGANKEEFRQSLQKSSQAIETFEERVDKSSQNLDELIYSLKDLVEENRESFKVNLEGIKELIDKTERSLKLLNESLEKMNKGEGTLGKLINEPELYQRAEGAVENLEKVLDPLSALKVSAGLRTDYYSESDLVKSQISLCVWPTVNYFLLTQVVHNPWIDKFTYSAQGGLRWGALAPRAGIMESEVGAGVDYFVLQDRLSFSIESFDFNRRPRPHFRFWTRYAAAKYLNIIFGIDDFTLTPAREVFFGLELGF